MGIAAASQVAVPAGYVERLERYGDDEQLRSILSGIDDLEDDLDAFVRGQNVDIPEPRL